MEVDYGGRRTSINMENGVRWEKRKTYPWLGGGKADELRKVENPPFISLSTHTYTVQVELGHVLQGYHATEDKLLQENDDDCDYDGEKIIVDKRRMIKT